MPLTKMGYPLPSVFTYHHMNEHALLINLVNSEENTLLLRFAAAQALIKRYGNNIVINQGVASLLALWPALVITKEQIEEVKQLLKNLDVENIEAGTHWRLPIFYDKNATDLQTVATQLHLDIDEVISLHKSAVYTVSFIGFLPGFPYLTGLPEALAVPRKAAPVAHVSQGSVAIAAGFCGIYPQASPGGWYVLGNCPVPLFDKEREQPFLLRPMDTVSFQGITEKAWKSAVKENKFTDLNTYKHG